MDGENTALSINGRDICYTFEYVDIFNLKFYRRNPRIASLISSGDEISEEKIDRILWDRNTTHTLYTKIKDDGGLIHPLLVYGNEVLEGNTRLCCYRHLYANEKGEKWKKVRCQVIKEELTQEEVYRLLCTEHIEGKTEWEAYEKANLYRKMKVEEHMSLEKISKIVGESASTVGHRIKAYQMMISNDITDKTKYSHFDQLVRNDELQEICKREPYVEAHVIDMIKNDKIPTAQNVRILPDIYKHTSARRRLYEGQDDITQIYHDLKARAPMTDSAFMKDVEKMVKRVNKLNREEREGLKQSKRDASKVRQLTEEFIKLCNELEVKIYVPKKMRKD